MGVADRGEHVDSGGHPGVDLDLGAPADGAAEVGDVELRRYGWIRDVQLQIAPVDVEDVGVGRDAAVRPERFRAALEMPGPLLAVSFAAGRCRGVEPAGFVSAPGRGVERLVGMEAVG